MKIIYNNNDIKIESSKKGFRLLSKGISQKSIWGNEYFENEKLLYHYNKSLKSTDFRPLPELKEGVGKILLNGNWFIGCPIVCAPNAEKLQYMDILYKREITGTLVNNTNVPVIIKSSYMRGTDDLVVNPNEGIFCLRGGNAERFSKYKIFNTSDLIKKHE